MAAVGCEWGGLMRDDETYIVRSVDDACVAVGIAVLDLMANGVEMVVVAKREGGGYVCGDVGFQDMRELRPA